MTMLTIALISAVYLPQGSVGQISDNPLSKGEVAYIEASNNESYVYVGSGSTRPLKVVDESAVRGHEYEYLDRDDFIVEAVTNLSRNAEDDSLQTTDIEVGSTHSFRFVVPSGVSFDDVEFDNYVKCNIAGGIINKGLIQKIRSGNTVTVCIVNNIHGGTELTVSNFRVKRLMYGDPSYVNDLTRKIVNCHDTASDEFGDLPLGKWRRWLAHLYDGNRGEDWSTYDSKSNVRMGQNTVSCGVVDRGLPQFAVGTLAGETNTVATLLSGRPAVKYYKQGTAGATWIGFKSISVGESAVTFTLAVSNATEYSASKLRLYHSDSVGKADAKWLQVAFTQTSSNPITITTVKTNASNSYYRLSYGDVHLVVEICDTLKVDRLILKGDNGSWYRIGVNSQGSVVATPQE